MKSTHPKSAAKAARKSAVTSIESSLIATLKEAVSKTGQNAEKLLKNRKRFKKAG